MQTAVTENGRETQSGSAPFESEGNNGIENGMITVFEPASNTYPRHAYIIKMKKNYCPAQKQWAAIIQCPQL